MHTQGKWKITPNTPFEFWIYVEEEEKQFDRLKVIASIKSNPMAGISQEEATANVLLMAAAKGMFEALNKIIEMNLQEALDRYGDAKKAESWACVQVAREAIAKARPGVSKNENTIPRD